MPRPLPPPHAIEPFLASRGLRPLSIANYTRIIRRIERAGAEPEAWLASQVTPKTPKRTLAVLRSAVAYLVEWTRGTPREVTNQTLPSVRPQPEGRSREALTPEQLKAYYEAAEALDEPYRTMLLLLPRTGLRIFELCALTYETFDEDAGDLDISGKRGRRRRVPLSKVARRLLDEYVRTEKPEPPHLFWTQGLLPRPVTPRDVRRVTKALSEQHRTLLWALSPHVLRHTTATALLDEGVNLKVIQDILGHATVRSLDPYLHTRPGQKRAALDRLQ
jgi:integrase